jgi:hypothetical protein
MTLRIIGSGFGRTGTLSLKTALETLNLGPCHHMEEVLHNPAQVPFWQAIAAGEPVIWEEVFAGYHSQVDWPGAHVWRELSAAYPEAQIIHTTRPEDDWWNSFSATIAVVLSNYQTMPAPPHVKAMMTAAVSMIGEQTFGGKPNDRATAIAAFRQREADVRAAIPPERLLVFNVVQGWAPLCNFLNVPIPATAFPRSNSTEDFWKTLKGEKP